MRSTRRSLLFGLGVGTFTAAVSPAFAGIRFPRPAQSELDSGATSSLIHLDRNENPYGPSERALAAMRECISSANRYPDGSEALQEKIARLHKVKTDQVVLGCGSSEVMRMAADAFLRPGKKLIMARPSYPLPGSYAQSKSVEVVEVPLTADRRHDLAAMLAKSDASTGMVYICNPNNPTGTITPRREIEELLSKLPANVPVVIDEAYHDYVIPNSSYASFVDQPAGDGRTIVTRTFSTIYGLAGLRIGYGVTSPEMARQLSPFGLHFGENAVALSAAMAALDDIDYIRLSAQRNTDQRQEFWNKANVRMVNVTESLANFLLVHPDHPSQEIAAHLRKNNVLVASDLPGMGDFIRVSIGRPDELNEFWRAWDMMPHHFMHR